MDTYLLNKFVLKKTRYLKQEVIMRKAVLGLLFVMCCYSAISQEAGSLRGKVFDGQSGKPVENAAIHLQTGSFQVITDSKGFYHLKEIPAGEYLLQVSHVSYNVIEKAVTISPGQELVLDLEMAQKVEPLQEVVIEGAGLENNIISPLPYIETKFTRDQIEGEAVRDITDYLRSSKNINGIRKGGTQLDPVVRGFKYSQLNVQLNGGQKIEGGCPNRMDPATAHVEIEDIESIEVLKGPYALRYGPMFGGLVNLTTEIPPHTDSSYIHLDALQSYETNWNGNKQHLNVYGGYKWFYYNFSGGRKDYGNYVDGNGNEVKSEFSKYNYKGQLGFMPFRNHALTFNFEESKGRNIRFPTLPMDERKDDTRLLSADYRATDIAEIFESFRLKAYLSDVRHEMDNKYRPFSDTVVAVSIIDAVNQGLRLETGYNIAGGSLLAGLDYENIKKDGIRTKNMIMQPGLPVKKEQLWNNAVISNIGFFAEYTAALKSWEFIASARLDLNQANSGDIIIQHPMQGEIYHYGTDSIDSQFTNFSINIGATWNIHQDLAVSLALGRGVRSPDMTERFIILLPIGYDKFDYLGNPQLKPEANNQVDLTLKYTGSRFGMFQVNGFYSFVNDFITGKRLPPVEQKPLTPDVLGVKQFYNAGNARLRGFELSFVTPMRHNLGGSIFASYTHGTIDEALKHIMNENGEVTGDVWLSNDAMTEIPPLEATVNVHYRLFGDKLIPKFNIRMVSTQKHVSEAFYEAETPGFVTMGLSINYTFNKYVRFYTGVDNLFDVAYYEHLNRNIIGSQQDLYEPGRSFYFNLYFSF
jgi:iron complex outermembrane receptor protein